MSETKDKRVKESKKQKNPTECKVASVEKNKEEKESNKRKHEDTESATHSANDWEHADLGDDNRKNKFLRLLGASKKDHHGKIIIGDKKPAHGRSKEETEKVTEDLEEQYNQGLEMKISGQARRHVGLGFHGNEADAKDRDSSKGSSSDKDKSSDDDVKLKEAENSPKPKEKMFGLFVKSSQ